MASPPTRTDTRERHTTVDPAPAPVAQRPATAPPPREGRRRGRALWLLAGLAAVVLAGLVTYWAVVRDGDGNDPSDTAAGPTTSAAATTDPGTDDEEPAPTSESEEPAATSEPEAPPADDPAAATAQFFALIPGNLAAAYELTSPEFQANTPFANFSGFWDNYSSVQIADVRTESPTSALVEITYVSGGSSETEVHRLRFTQADDGRLLLLDDRIA